VCAARSWGSGGQPLLTSLLRDSETERSARVPSTSVTGGSRASMRFPPPDCDDRTAMDASVVRGGRSTILSRDQSEEIARFVWYERRCSRTHTVGHDRGCGLLNESLVDSFTEWAALVEPKLRHALTASFGSQLGKDAAADALAYAWSHWDVVSATDNRLGYVYGVGRNMARRGARRRPVFLPVASHRLPDVEPRLPGAIAGLSERQRVVITLVYGYQWTLSEVADLLGTSKSTVQNHAERGLTRLRKSLGVEL
jgi:DNA-directed RNA polymerase specialized sigma24 family protein